MAWDNRFGIEASKGNKCYHHYGRSYFDKPERAKVDTILLNKKVTYEAINTPTRFPVKSRAVKRRTLSVETGWDHRFNILPSKDNSYIPRARRAFFKAQTLDPIKNLPSSPYTEKAYPPLTSSLTNPGAIE